jgi:hypothetical protein
LRFRQNTGVLRSAQNDDIKIRYLRALAVDAEAIFPAVVGLYFFEARVGGVTHLGAADVGEASRGELFGHSFVVPHPEVAGAAEDGGGNGSQASRGRRFAEPALLHEAGAGRGCGVAGVESDELFEVREHKAKGATGTKIGEDVFEGDAEFVEGHVLEDMGAVDCFGRLRWDGKAFDNVAVADVFGIGRKAFFYQQRGEKRETALQPEGGTSIEVLPGFRSTHATTKLHILVIHGRIIHSVERGFGLEQWLRSM